MQQFTENSNMNWKDIPGYEGLYQASDCGQVKSCERVVHNPRYGEHRLKERILKPRLDKYGYLYVTLYKNGNGKNRKIHRLVMLAHIGPSDMTVNHIDECKTNNHILNLEYVTTGDNTRAWIKNNLKRRAEVTKKGQEASLKARSKQVLDTYTGKIFPSIMEASRYMHEEEAKGVQAWMHRILRGTQDRFKILNSN